MSNSETLILTGDGYNLAISPDAQAQKSAALITARAIVAVASNEASSSAQFEIRNLSAMRILVEKSRKEVKEPVTRIGKLIDQTAKDFLEEIESEELRIRELVGHHANVVANEKARLIAEERRIADEARAAREAAESAREQAENTGKISDVVASRQAELLRQSSLADRQQAADATHETKVAEGIRFAWDFEVINLHTMLAFPELVEITPRRAVILQYLKDFEKEGDTPEQIEAVTKLWGIRAFKKPVVSTR